MVSEEKLFENVNGRTDGRKVIIIAHPEQSSGELKISPICHLETICMKCQILFSGKNKKNISNLQAAENFTQKAKR